MDTQKKTPSEAQHHKIDAPPQPSIPTVTEGVRFECTICGVKFSRRRLLTKHMSMHIGKSEFKFPYACVVCDAKFRYRCRLVGHMRIHTGEKPFRCITCNMKFSRKWVLTRHIRLHTVKPFNCAICNMKFAQNSSLKKHIGRRHPVGKTTRCTCNLKFWGLPRHDVNSCTAIARKSTIQYQCEICGAKFARSWTLKNHVKSEHMTVYATQYNEQRHEEFTNTKSTNRIPTQLPINMVIFRM